jgi:hypothetical protein
MTSIGLLIAIVGPAHAQTAGSLSDYLTCYDSVTADPAADSKAEPFRSVPCVGGPLNGVYLISEKGALFLSQKELAGIEEREPQLQETRKNPIYQEVGKTAVMPKQIGTQIVVTKTYKVVVQNSGKETVVNYVVEETSLAGSKQPPTKVTRVLPDFIAGKPARQVDPGFAIETNPPVIKRGLNPPYPLEALGPMDQPQVRASIAAEAARRVTRVSRPDGGVDPYIVVGMKAGVANFTEWRDRSEKACKDLKGDPEIKKVLEKLESLASRRSGSGLNNVNGGGLNGKTKGQGTAK